MSALLVLAGLLLLGVLTMHWLDMRDTLKRYRAARDEMDKRHAAERAELAKIRAGWVERDGSQMKWKEITPVDFRKGSRR